MLLPSDGKPGSRSAPAFLATFFTAILFAAAILGITTPAFAQANFSAEAPYFAKAGTPESLRLPLGVARITPLRLAAPDAKTIDAVKHANTRGLNKRLQIGIARFTDAIAEAQSDSLRWSQVQGGWAAQWEVTSANASALRIGLVAVRMPFGIELRFAGNRQIDTVYGPFYERDLAADGPIYWSPVLEGDTATIEIFVPETESPSDVSLVISQISHLFASPSEADIESQAKAAESCEVDLICRSAFDGALASTGKAVARMTFTESNGGTFLCTGTLLNPIGGSFIPYFYSATHCISLQSVASTLTTHWFYDRTGCGSGGTSPNYVQLTGGATLLYANTFFDALLLRLNRTPPAGAVFSGWDAATLSIGTALTAVHHPAGDLKKVSLGTVGGFTSPPGGPGAILLISNWNSTATGVTEGGSSGSGIFTAVGSPAPEYRLRGGLYGGPSSCTASTADLHDYYSRLDQVYPELAQYLNPATVTCSFTLLPASVTLGSGTASGSLGVTATSGCAWTATSNATWLTTSSSGSRSGTVNYSVAPNTSTSSRVGTLTIGGHPFTVTQQGAASGINPATTMVVEYYYAKADEYFITADRAEISALDNNRFPGWVRTNLSFGAYATATGGASPVCRFYIPPTSHFYSASPAECALTQQKFPSLAYESPNVFYIALPNTATGGCPTGTIPVYRLFDNRADPNHRYTTSTAVVDQMRARGWIQEGYGPGPHYPIMCSVNS